MQSWNIISAGNFYKNLKLARSEMLVKVQYPKIGERVKNFPGKKVRVLNFTDQKSTGIAQISL
jgi:hypothetical protein